MICWVATPAELVGAVTAVIAGAMALRGRLPWATGVFCYAISPAVLAFWAVVIALIDPADLIREEFIGTYVVAGLSALLCVAMVHLAPPRGSVHRAFAERAAPPIP